MNTLFKTLLLATLLLSGQATLATPQADARLIAQRNSDSAWMKTVHRGLKEAFVTVYFKPISGLGLGIVIADTEQFVELIPDEDIAPYIDRLTSKTEELYLSNYTPEQLASIAAILRADENATMEGIVLERYQRRHAVALEQARTDAQSSGSDDPVLVELEELAVRLNAFAAMLEEDDGKAFRQSIALSLGTFMTFVGYEAEIRQIEQNLDNPISMAALKADRMLRFANPVQRQNLLRQFSASERAGGIQFIKPPTGDAQSN